MARMAKLSEPRRRGLEMLAKGPARLSNMTGIDHHGRGCIYWQVAEWAIQFDYATRSINAGSTLVMITSTGRSRLAIDRARKGRPRSNISGNKSPDRDNAGDPSVRT